MSQPILIKVYGNLWPIDKLFFQQLEEACAASLPGDALKLAQEGNLARISFEGIYFPMEEILNLIEINLAPDMQGKLDLLDMENWCMTRYQFENGKISSHSAPLNNVLDYSGH